MLSLPAPSRSNVAVTGSPSLMAAVGAPGHHGATSMWSRHGHHQGHRDPLWKMAPSSHTCSFSLLEEGITAPGFRGHGHHPSSMVWDMGSGGRIDLREAGEKTKPKPAPWPFACPVIQRHSMESVLSHQSFQVLQDASHNLQSSQVHAHMR